MKHLPAANLKAINNVRIYLQVCYLSEITDANGLVLLPEITTQHTAPPHSTILWPQQPIPPPDAWKQWSWAIHTLYTRPNSDRLQQPLTMWQPTAMNENWKWDWRINPHTRALYHWNRTHWTVRYPHNARRTYIDYTMHQRRTTLTNPASLPPATPIIDNTAQTIRILLPIHPIDKGLETPRWLDGDLLTRLTTAPHTWLETLWHRI